MKPSDQLGVSGWVDVFACLDSFQRRSTDWVPSRLWRAKQIAQRTNWRSF